jgi:hypothetical protein
VFTVEQRDALRDRVLTMGTRDERVVAGAIVGSLAVGAGDRYSDVDLTFGVAEGADVADVLGDWTHELVARDGALRLVDLVRGPTTYRVFLCPDALQLDLSMTPTADFRPAGPRFRLEFGTLAPDRPEAPRTPPPGDLFIATPTVREDVFGWGVIYALHARACIERGRVWQAEHYLGAVRDHGLALACLREGVTPVQARGADDLSAETLARFDGSRSATLDAGPMRRALAAAAGGLVREALDGGLPHAHTIADRLAGASLMPPADERST